MARVVGVISGKGGVGKTVVAINTAAALQKYYGMKVLLVDCNITTSHIGLYLGIYSTPVTLNDALKGHIGIEKTIYEHPSGINVIPASLKLEDLKDMDWHVVKERLVDILDKYDFILLDSSPGFNRESLITLEASQEALMVTNPIVHTVADLIKCRQLCEELHVKPLGIVVNMIRGKKYELAKQEVEQMADIPIIASIPYSEAIMESIISKKPAVDLSHKIGAHFRRIADFLVSGTVAEENGFLEKLRKIFRPLSTTSKSHRSTNPQL